MVAHFNSLHSTNLTLKRKYMKPNGGIFDCLVFFLGNLRFLGLLGKEAILYRCLL